MAAGNSPDDAPVEHPQGRGGHNANRFSKYLRFAQRHRRDQSGGDREHSNNGSNDNVPVPQHDPEHETATSWRPRGNGMGSHL
jgi:hypothetical protein